MQLSIPRPTFLGDLPAGEPGTRATLRLMRELVQRFKRNETIRSTALELTQGLRPKDWLAEVNALFVFARDAVRYVRDVMGVETLQTPTVTLEVRAGDCDDKATLLASLLQAIGHPTRFVAVGFNSTGNYSHVYLETKVGERWLALDPTVSSATVGWAPPRRALARMVVHN